MTRVGLLIAAIVFCMLPGCRTPREWKQNGFKVGPNYQRPTEPVANTWVDAADSRLISQSAELASWWTNLNDPVLDQLVQNAYQQNLSIRDAAFRVLQARAELGIAQGRFFPQQQYLDGGYTQQKFSGANASSAFLPTSSFGNWQYGFGLAWELDFWGKYRRMIEAADAHLDASIEDYDAAIVTLIGDVAQNYVQLRIVEAQLVYIDDNVKLQKETLGIAQARFNGGQATELDVDQAKSVLAQTESQTPSLEIQRRQLEESFARMSRSVPRSRPDSFHTSRSRCRYPSRLAPKSPRCSPPRTQDRYGIRPHRDGRSRSVPRNFGDRESGL